jgi:glutathione synthase/RimK-type ligase-like ATP-grasp enzyme
VGCGPEPGTGSLGPRAARRHLRSGVVAINAPRSIELVRNKIAMHAVLLEHEMPLPKTWFASDAAVFRSLPLDCFPLVVKPYDGDGSVGLALLRRPEDVELLPDFRGNKSLTWLRNIWKPRGGISSCTG